MDTYYDKHGNELAVGSRVRHTYTNEVGVITKITDLDGDVDDHGRSYPIYPRAYISYSLLEEDYSVAFTIITNRYNGDADFIEWMIDEDIELIEEGRNHMLLGLVLAAAVTTIIIVIIVFLVMRLGE